MSVCKQGTVPGSPDMVVCLCWLVMGIEVILKHCGM